MQRILPSRQDALPVVTAGNAHHRLSDEVVAQGGIPRKHLVRGLPRRHD
ncbi:MAG: hypothetical protein JSW12_08035 [Deltaproteobacteria bacterium]|nr:MAG: hypothetical protein JSW12_08035 [Deltaproteobacteria bacterium]